jgi:hypothetical protein
MIWMKKVIVIIVERKQEQIELSSSNIAETPIAPQRKSLSQVESGIRESG